MFARSLLGLVILAACSTPAQKSTSTPESAPAPISTPTSTNPGPPAPVATPGPGVGEKCGEGDACGSDAKCVSYYGIAGPRGPQFKTCEITCEKGTTCPTGRTCATIADGPGQVCR